MKPALQSEVTVWWRINCLLLATVLFTGCSLTEHIPGSKKLKGLIPGIDDQQQKSLTVGDLTVPKGMNYLKVESIGLVTGLNNTGSKPPTGAQRQMLIDEMQTHNVENPNATLASPRTSLVLLRGYLPPGVRKGDPFDIEVRVPTHSQTTSLRDGNLLRSRMRELAIHNYNVRTGHVAALSEGSVLVHSLFRGEADNTNTRSGVILGGGTSQMERPLGLVIKSNYSSIRTATRIASAINRRFLQYTDDNSKGIASAKSDNYIELGVHESYRHNVSRYINVIRSIVVGESDIASHERKELLLAKLLEPTTAAAAAMDLEAIGPESITTLRQGLSSEDAEVRFYAAESLAYLDEPDAAPVLSRLAAENIAFRWHAMTALAGMDHVNALDAITELLNAESAQTRVGAFRALWTRSPNSPLVKGRNYGDFSFHQVESSAYPMVHIAMSKRPEVVAFGADIHITLTQPVFTPADLSLANKKITVKSKGNGELQISKFEVGKQDRFASSTTRLADLIRAISEVGGTYSDVVDLLQSLRKTDAINARVLVGARPRPVWNYNRGSDAAEGDQQAWFDITSPLPDLYVDRLFETEAETVKRNNTRADAVSSGSSASDSYSTGFFDRVTSIIPGL